MGLWICKIKSTAAINVWIRCHLLNTSVSREMLSCLGELTCPIFQPSLGRLKQTLETPQCSQSVSQKTWYLAMIQPKLSYGSNSFFPSLNADGMSCIERMSKSGLRAMFGLQNPVPMQPLREKLRVSCIEVLIFVYRVITGLASSLFKSYVLLASQTADGTHRITRGQETRLLLVPFLPGPAGRASIRFQGSIVWNELTANARSANQGSYLPIIPVTTHH